MFENELIKLGEAMVYARRQRTKILSANKLARAQDLLYVKAAKEQHECEGVIEFDNQPRVSRSPDGDEGAYVSAWTWVSTDDLETTWPKSLQDHEREFNEVNTPSGQGDHVHDHLHGDLAAAVRHLAVTIENADTAKTVQVDNLRHTRMFEQRDDYRQALDELLRELVDADLAHGAEFTESEQGVIDNAKAVFAKWITDKPAC